MGQESDFTQARIQSGGGHISSHNQVHTGGVYHIYNYGSAMLPPTSGPVPAPPEMPSEDSQDKTKSTSSEPPIPDLVRAPYEHACDMFRQQRYADAEELYREALRRSEEALGRNHLGSIRCLDGLASVLWVSRKFPDAEATAQQAVELRCAVQGCDHADTLTSMAAVSRAKFEQGDYQRSVELDRVILERRRGTLGPDDPSSVRSLGMLALSLSYTGCYAEAEKFGEQAYTKSQMLYGLDHEETAWVANIYASSLYSLTRYGEAEAIYRAIIGVRPDDASVQLQLAETITLMGRSSESEQIYRALLERLQAGEIQAGDISGYNQASSYWTWESYLWILWGHASEGLAVALYDSGRGAEAEPFFRQALQTYSSMYGDTDTNTLRAQTRLNYLLSTMKKFKKPAKQGECIIS